eukprot:11449535-Alexandrium_andersonii.AAC.1
MARTCLAPPNCSNAATIAVTSQTAHTCSNNNGRILQNSAKAITIRVRHGLQPRGNDKGLQITQL